MIVSFHCISSLYMPKERIALVSNRFNSIYIHFLLFFMLLLTNTVSAQKTTLAIVDLEGIGISAPEAVALSNRLRNELIKLDVYSVVERGLMASILAEQDFQMTGCTSNECLVEAGQLIGAEILSPKAIHIVVPK